MTLSRPRLPALGLGTAAIGNLYRPVSDSEAEALLEAAWAAGIRYFDTAPFYRLGRAEQRLGRFLAGLEETVLISTKVGRVLDPAYLGAAPEVGFVDPLPIVPRFDYSRDGILRSFDQSVLRLGRVPDIVLIHDIGKFAHGAEGNAVHLAALRSGGFRALEELCHQGVRATGIGVNEVEVGLELFDELHLDVVLIAGRHTLLDRSAAPLLRRAEALGTGIVVAGVFNSGILATGPRHGAMFDYAPASKEVLLRAGKLESIAAQHCVSLPTLAVQFPARDPAVTTLLLGAASSAELASSLAELERPVPTGAWSDVDSVL